MKKEELLRNMYHIIRYMNDVIRNHEDEMKSENNTSFQAGLFCGEMKDVRNDLRELASEYNGTSDAVNKYKKT